MQEYHVPVLLSESLKGLNIRKGGIYVDLTFGAGGHSRAILELLGDRGKLYGFDQDEDAWKNALDDPRFILVKANFRHIHRFMRFYGEEQVDGVLMDLGVSSHQINWAERGFSYRFEANLDMRMNIRQPVCAVHILNDYPEYRLQQVFSRYGEIRNAKMLAKSIAEQRTHQKLITTGQLNSILKSLAIGPEVKYYSKVYQAIRMEVNDEEGALKEAMEGSIKVLRNGGRLVVISYHSIEDRLVKNFIRSGNAEGQLEKDFFGHGHKPLTAVNKKPILSGEEELKNNPRSRSAKLRIAEKN